jgi:hypothetical protein
MEDVGDDGSDLREWPLLTGAFHAGSIDVSGFEGGSPGGIGVAGWLGTRSSYGR